MTEQKHTPGPWQVAHRKGLPVVRGPSTECVATLPTPLHDGFGISIGEEVVGNAHLIAAAPDLYEALDEAFAFLGGVDDASLIRTRILTALLKATPKAS